MTIPNHDNLLHCFWTALVTPLSIFPFFWFTTTSQELQVIFVYIGPENIMDFDGHMTVTITFSSPCYFILTSSTSKCFPRSGGDNAATVLPVGTKLGPRIKVDVAG